MEQFVLVTDSVYNKSLITKSVTKQERPKIQHSQNPMCQIDPLKKETNTNLFAKVDPLADKILSCPRIKLSKSKTLILTVVEIGVSLSDFARKLGRKNADVPDFYFTLLDAAGLSPTLVLTQSTTAKERASWVPVKKMSEDAKI